MFFFETKTIQKIFLKKKPHYNLEEVIVSNFKTPAIIAFSIYFLIQIGLPLRHYFFKDNVLWTEEGHRLSWRMMLRAKSGYAIYKVENNETGKTHIVNLDNYLTKKQKQAASTKPDIIWQFAQRLNKQFK